MTKNRPAYKINHQDEKKVKKTELGHFNYKKTAWFKTIRNENRLYKYNLMFFSLLAALLVPIILYVSDIFEHESVPFLNYLIPFCLMTGMLVFLVKFRNIKVMIILTLTLAVVGGLGTVYMRGGSKVYIVILSVFPALVVQLRGTIKGTIWFGAVLIGFMSMYILQKTGILPPWLALLSPLDLVAAITASLLIFLFSFFTERRQEVLVRRLADMLVFDDATGLPNKDVLIHSINPTKPYIFAIIKIENYSDLVALFGYEFSDTISQFASQKLRKNENRFHYKTYQLKYNEYGILIDLDNLQTVAETTQLLNDIIKSIEIESLPWETDKIRLAYRVGATIIDPADTRNPLSKADVALKKAERGHSALTVYEEDNTEKESAYDYTIRFTELINNRENDSFRAVFQPVFNGEGTRIEWYEALLRIKRQNGEYVSIFPYLTVARSTGFYQVLTDFILRKSAEAIVEFDVDVSINITINDIVRPEFILLVDEAYQKIKDKKGRIIFEILESDELVELDKCIWFIDYIAHYGFRIAIDDFGTGYSNYCSLVNLPIDIVKIDGSLIKKIQVDENAKILVEGIVHFCKKSNKKIVAEFVEDRQVFESLKSMNIDFLQGYYLGVPAAITGCPTLPSV